jgi:hypothetical protein
LAASTSAPEEPSRTSPSVTQRVIYTTTMADGDTVTVTSVTIVNADQAVSQGSGPETSTNTADVSLQEGAAASRRQHGKLSWYMGISGIALAWAL